jgi:hypothetical protein
MDAASYGIIASSPLGDTVALEALLPDRWVAAHPEHELEQWEEEPCETRPAVIGNGLLAVLPPPNKRW